MEFQWLVDDCCQRQCIIDHRCLEVYYATNIFRHIPLKFEKSSSSGNIRKKKRMKLSSDSMLTYDVPPLVTSWYKFAKNSMLRINFQTCWVDGRTSHFLKCQFTEQSTNHKRKTLARESEGSEVAMTTLLDIVRKRDNGGARKHCFWLNNSVMRLETQIPMSGVRYFMSPILSKTTGLLSYDRITVKWLISRKI